ncbi:MAG: TlpA disulfide reductase family protein [Saprospiraceae bacterium]
MLRVSTLLFTLLTAVSIFNSCVHIPNPFSGLPPGVWRGVLKLDGDRIAIGEVDPDEQVGKAIEEVTDGELPFEFEVIYDNDTTFHIEIINGDERINVPTKNITMALDRRTAKDTLTIDFPIYDSKIKAIYEEDIMEGEWIVENRGEPYAIKFAAFHGRGFRFTNLKKEPVMDISGKWAVTFGTNEDEPYPAIGEFKQEGNKVTGTFRTETGDYRFLEGTIQANKLYLSVFDGSHAFLFEAKILEDKSMIGTFRSGKHYKTTWEAVKDDKVTLKSPNDLTYLNEGYDRIEFAFPNPQGDTISIDDEKYAGKAKLIQIMGTWCPNCRDETKFLAEYFKANPNPNLEVITLAFERYRETDKAMAAIAEYKDFFGIDWEVLHAGYYDKKEAAQALPMLNHILSYPTLIFIDQNNQVQKIHTGFNGPATSAYEGFVEEFEGDIKALTIKAM